MQKRIFSLAFAAVLGLGLTGCVGKTGAGIPETKQLQRMEPKTVTFNFPTKDCVTGENIQFDLSSQDFSNNIAGYSRFPAFRATRYGAVTDYSGLKVEKKQDSYTIKYANGELNTRSWYLTEAIFDIKYSVSNNQITFMYPASYVYQPFANAIGIGIDPLAPKASMEADVARIYSKLDNLVVSFNKSYAYKGEVNTKYPDKAIYANFKRILGNYNWRAEDKLTDVKKENTFALNFKGQTFPLVVEVFPYRDGSKVIYSYSIQYTIDSKGNCSASKADIDELNKKIEKIIND